jgi:RNA polymerase sigma-70 factor (ECF subfamily)
MAESIAVWAVPGDATRQSAVSQAVAHAEAGALFAAWRNGDCAAFDELVARFHSMVSRVARSLLAVRTDAEDAVQETFWRFYRSGASLRNPELLQAWLYRTVVNVCRGMSARERRRGEVGLEHSLAAEWPSLESGARLALREAIEASLRELTPKEREAVVLRDVENLEIHEVAKAMNVFEVTVRTHLSRGRLKLRESLARKGVKP